MSIMQLADLHHAAGTSGVKELFALRQAVSIRPSRLAGRAKGRHRRQRSLSEGRPDMVTPKEFASLPTSIQRKYFSSVERLRIAQQSSANKRRRQTQKQTWLSSASSADLVAPPSIPSQRLSPSQPGDSELVASQQGSFKEPITVDQAQWFLSLPEKVRKQHLSREELLLLTRHSRDVLQGSRLDLEETSARLSEHSGSVIAEASESDVEESVPVESVSIADAVKDVTSSFLDTDATSPQAEERGEAEMAMFKLYAKHRASLVTVGTNIPPQSQHPVSLPTPAPEHKLRRKSLHRALALTPVVLPPPTLAPAPSIPSPSTVRNFAVSARLSRPPNEPSLQPDSMPPQARYYQDPDTRKQLRTFLLSPQRFDEALEFGFPSSTGPPPSACSDMSFPIQRTESAFSDSLDDNVSLDTCGPATPTWALDHHFAQAASSDSGIGLPLQLNTMTKTSVDFRSRSSSRSFGNRDMTMRTTLTRPELRAPEDKLYSYQRTQTSGVEVSDTDPLALDPLDICDDPTGAHGAFAANEAVQEKGLRRVWKSFRPRWSA